MCVCVCVCVCVCARACLVAQWCPTLYNPMDCSHPGSSVHGILQARILEKIVIPFSREFSDPVIEPRSLVLVLDSLPSEAPGKPPFIHIGMYLWTWIRMKLARTHRK